jgi:protein AbiQ
MIPIRDDVMRSVELNVSDSDSSAEAKYKRLMNKEYACCVKLKEDILQKAEKVYEKQIKTGKVAKFCCDFLLLEKACDEYSVNVVSSK